jgi:hypothetical protein
MGNLVSYDIHHHAFEAVVENAIPHLLWRAC